MWKQKTKIFFIVNLLSILIIYGCGSTPSDEGGGSNQEPPPEAQAAKVFISPVTDTVIPGSTLSRMVEVENIDKMFYAAFDLTYDPSVIEYMDASEGTFLNRNGTAATSFHATLLDGNQGRVTIGLTRLGAIGDVSGDGTLLTLTFMAKDPGSTSLTFASPRGVKDSANQDLTIDEWESSTIAVE